MTRRPYAALTLSALLLGSTPLALAQPVPIPLPQGTPRPTAKSVN